MWDQVVNGRYELLIYLSLTAASCIFHEWAYEKEAFRCTFKLSLDIIILLIYYILRNIWVKLNVVNKHNYMYIF